MFKNEKNGVNFLLRLASVFPRLFKFIGSATISSFIVYICLTIYSLFPHKKTILTHLESCSISHLGFMAQTSFLLIIGLATLSFLFKRYRSYINKNFESLIKMQPIFKKRKSFVVNLFVSTLDCFLVLLTICLYLYSVIYMYGFAFEKVCPLVIPESDAPDMFEAMSALIFFSTIIMTGLLVLFYVSIFVKISTAYTSHKQA